MQTNLAAVNSQAETKKKETRLPYQNTCAHICVIRDQESWRF